MQSVPQSQMQQFLAHQESQRPQPTDFANSTDLAPVCICETVDS